MKLLLTPADEPVLALLLLASSSLLSSEKRDRPLPPDIGRDTVRGAVEAAGCPKLELRPDAAGADCVKLFPTPAELMPGDDPLLALLLLASSSLRSSENLDRPLEDIEDRGTLEVTGAVFRTGWGKEEPTLEEVCLAFILRSSSILRSSENLDRPFPLIGAFTGVTGDGVFIGETKLLPTAAELPFAFILRCSSSLRSSENRDRPLPV